MKEYLSLNQSKRNLIKLEMHLKQILLDIEYGKTDAALHEANKSLKLIKESQGCLNEITIDCIPDSLKPRL